MENEVITEQFITTNDNPFNPFKQFKDWYSYDRTLGYNTCELIDRMYSSLVENDENFNEETKEQFLIESMKRIVALNPEIYKTITHDTFIETIPMGDTDKDED